MAKTPERPLLDGFPAIHVCEFFTAAMSLPAELLSFGSMI
jgi:hypothetical protein